MNSISRYSIFFILLFSIQLQAADYSIVGALNITQMTEENSQGTVKGDGLLKYGGGLLVDFDLAPSFQMTTGLLYLDRTFGFERDQFQAAFLQAPFLLKINFTSAFYFSLGLYLDYLLGDVNRQVNNVESIDNSFTDLNYGGQAGIGYKHPLDESIQLIVEFDYLKDLSNRFDAPSIIREFNEYRLLLGIHWGSSSVDDYAPSSGFGERRY